MLASSNRNRPSPLGCAVAAGFGPAAPAGSAPWGRGASTLAPIGGAPRGVPPPVCAAGLTPVLLRRMTTGRMGASWGPGGPPGHDRFEVVGPHAPAWTPALARERAGRPGAA